MYDYNKMTYGEKVLNSIYYLHKKLGLEFDADTIMFLFFKGIIYRKDMDSGSFWVYDDGDIYGMINVQNGDFIKKK